MSVSVFQSRSKLQLICCLLLFLAAIGLYNPITRAPFLNYDDDYYVVQNSHLRSGFTPENISWAFTTFDRANWHPVTWLSHILDVAMFGMNPAGHHYVNVLLHALNAILLFVFLQRSTGKLWRNITVAALFAIHPINVESVAWISERKNVLSMAFFLLGMLAYLRYARKPGVGRYIWVMVCFALGLMTKPQVITFPFALLLLDYWPLDRASFPSSRSASETESQPRRTLFFLLSEKIPLLCLSVASAVVTLAAQKTAIHQEFPFSFRFENALLAYAKYLSRMVWPANLAPLYPYPTSVNAVRAVLTGLLLLAVSILVIRARQHRYLALGWFWFLGTMVPMIGLVQVGVQAMADRYAYIPFVGLFIISCWGIADLLSYLRVPRWASAFAALAVLAALAFSAHIQIGYWTDNLKLWTHTIEVTQKNFVAEDSLATALVTQGRIEEAAEHFREAVRIRPDDPVGNLNIGVYEQQRGNYKEAVMRFQSVFLLTSNPQLRGAALTHLGYIHANQKQYETAAEDFHSALSYWPDYSQALLGVGVVAQRTGNMIAAVNNYSRAVRSQPTDLGFLLLSQALQARGDNSGATDARASAERLSPDLTRAEASVRELLAP